MGKSPCNVCCPMEAVASQDEPVSATRHKLRILKHHIFSSSTFGCDAAATRRRKKILGATFCFWYRASTPTFGCDVAATPTFGCDAAATRRRKIFCLDALTPTFGCDAASTLTKEFFLSACENTQTHKCHPSTPQGQSASASPRGRGRRPRRANCTSASGRPGTASPTGVVSTGVRRVVTATNRNKDRCIVHSQRTKILAQPPKPSQSCKRTQCLRCSQCL
jgi:hypothetical protein